MNRIIYKTNEGGVTVIIPSDELKAVVPVALQETP